MELPSRKEKILCAVVESYIDSGEPIGSKALQTQTGLNVSSATIRNELADLVSKGYLLQPHTSAGRVPSAKGYRYYIDNLLEQKPLSDRVKSHIDMSISSAADAPEKILQKTAQVLSELSSMAAVTTTPSGYKARVHKIRFVITGRHTCMVVLITSNGMVKSRLFRCDFVVTPELIAMFDKALNDAFVGVPLKEIDRAFLQSVAASFGELSLFMPDVLIAILDAAKQAMQTTLNVSGSTNLLFLPSYDLLNARNVLRFLSNSEELSSLLEDNVQGTKVYLGKESGYYELKDSAVITTRYEIGGSTAGAIALVGPIRSDYKTLISQLEYASKCASSLIGELLEV
ncbi:MAG: heat-inducible transcription repressor HrcA [Ruminococcaceae bacterium]|nr:heat-inducible transcription repressor HrcA [Oscillospiraceae bacterium]